MNETRKRLNNLSGMLVRDLVPTIMAAQGKNPRVRPAKDGEEVGYLLKQLDGLVGVIAESCEAFVARVEGFKSLAEAADKGGAIIPPELAHLPKEQAQATLQHLNRQRAERGRQAVGLAQQRALDLLADARETLDALAYAVDATPGAVAEVQALRRHKGGGLGGGFILDDSAPEQPAPPPLELVGVED